MIREEIFCFSNKKPGFHAGGGGITPDDDPAVIVLRFSYSINTGVLYAFFIYSHLLSPFKYVESQNNF
jgi:hypothetical protein